MSTLYPRSNFLDVLDGNPDLYGPFWIATTVVVILFLTGTISSYLASEGKDHFAYDFKLLSGAAGLIYGYTLVVPVGLWAVLKWFGRDRGMGESGGGVVGVVEVLCLYGYANLIWIPVALVSWSPYGSESILGEIDWKSDLTDARDSSQLHIYCRRACCIRLLPCEESVRSPVFFTSRRLLSYV